MKRRSFLKGVAGYAAMYGTGLGAGFTFSDASAQGFQRALVNVMLIGGADYRFLLAPPPGTAYADMFWAARKSLYRYTAADQTAYNTYEDVWNDLYLPVNGASTAFGIHKNAGWLKTQFDAGNVAIICNVSGSENRRHDHSRLILNAGDLEADQLDTGRDGWGGRLAAAIGNANVISAAESVPVFCNSNNPGNRNENVVHIKDSRNFALPGEDGVVASDQSVIARALTDYYSVRGQEIENEISSGDLPGTWPYRRFFQHERSLRDFGGNLESRLEATGLLPATLKALATGSGALHNKSFGVQCANLYDCFVAQDVLSLRAAYMGYHGWDTHTKQKPRIENNYQDVLGVNGGLSVLTQELENVPDANDNIVYVFTTDFGRQLASSGTGTDHGRGNYMLLVGKPLAGGVYGEMFPAEEILPDAVGQAPFEKLGGDIAGRTSFERVLHRVCDWVKPGAGDVVFPNAKNRMLESGVDLTSLV